MNNKVERLAAMSDDKTLIATLIRECSDRVKLIEFKDARADIWQFFRLVQLDGQTLPYAVCIRCMKPVSYKAREGTGGLHRHPCSKAVHALVATDLTTPTTNNTTSNGTKSQSASTTPTTSSSSVSNSQNVSSPFRMLPNLPSSVANMSMNSLITANLASNFQYTFPEIKFEQSMSSPEQDEEAPALKLIELSMKELIPWRVTNETLHQFLNEVCQVDQHCGPSLEPLLEILYQKGTLKVREEISLQDYIPIIIDLWEVNSAKQLATLSVALEHKKQVIKTIDITLVDTYSELEEELNRARTMFCAPVQSHVYIFDNHYSRFAIPESNRLFICPLHELEDLIDEALRDNEDFPVTKALHEVQRFCHKQANFLSEILNARPTCWRERLALYKRALDNSDILKDVLADQDLKNVVNCDLWSFLGPYHDALHAYTTEPTFNVVTLWKAKLEDHSKPRDNDSLNVLRIKEHFRGPTEKRPLTTDGLMAVCLDPRFKKLKMLTVDWREATYAKLRDTVNELAVEHKAHVEVKQEPKNGPERVNMGPNPKRQKRSELISSFNEYMDDSNEAVKDELERYLESDTGQPADLEPFDFWCGEYGLRYPRLAVIAKQLLSIPIVPSTCHFLPSGRVLLNRKVAIAEKHLDQILFLNSLFTS